MKQRSFRLSVEDLSKLDDIKQLKNFDNAAEALRFCIQSAYDRLLEVDQPEQHSGTAELNQLIKKNNILLDFVLMELVKTHGGLSPEWDQTALDYLEKLKNIITQTLERKGIEVTNGRQFETESAPGL